ncbi:MAG: hypothetical protein HY403_11045 [Elusimicrobia bacterium]|nr:hypothetical protein [Elusimicrobiota bacterium]
MTTRAALACLCLSLAAVPARTEAPLNAPFDALSAATRAARADMILARRPPASADALPEPCADFPVVHIRDGDIYKDGELLGRAASSYKASCEGLVVWQDAYGDLYREKRRVADRVAQYDVAWHGDVFVWSDSYGELHRNGEHLGRAATYTFVKYTGDMVWKDGWGVLYRNREQFGRADRYAVAGRTGDVAWVDGFGTLHRNDQELGRAQSWAISDRTGVVGWLDGFRRLYKNGTQVGSGVDQFTLREDGKLIWMDAWGRYHSA